MYPVTPVLWPDTEGKKNGWICLELIVLISDSKVY